MTPIEKTLRQEIQRQGPISFARFMELALYDPDHGYYERSPRITGTAGDFYTSPTVGRLFGDLLAFQFAEWLDALPSGSPVQIVEAGAHDGQLASDILDWLGKNRPRLSERVSYWILEPSKRRREWQRATLQCFGDQVQWLPGFAVLPDRGISGILFSNELLDAFPIERFGWDASRQAWVEWRVQCHPAGFRWHPQWVPSPEILERRFAGAGMELSEALKAVLPDGFTLEVCPQAAHWWRTAAAALNAGVLLTMDYGFPGEEFLDARRRNGTLRAYRAHHLSADPLADPGEQDLTAHVNFTEIQKAGEAAGLRTEGLVSQAQFLIRIAERMWKGDPARSPWTASQTRQFQTLVHPEHMGRSFKVLVQVRGALRDTPGAEGLDGLVSPGQRLTRDRAKEHPNPPGSSDQSIE